MSNKNITEDHTDGENEENSQNQENEKFSEIMFPQEISEKAQSIPKD